MIAISRLHFPVTTLGPGRRVGIWFQGCTLRCPGCISVDTWDLDTGQVAIDEVRARLSAFATVADGVTVSGGEPLDQPDALAAVLTHWRSISATSVLLFTGKDLEAADEWLAVHPELVDAMITGPFKSEASQTLALRGSDNQKLHILSSKGEEFAQFDRLRDESDRRLDVMFGEDGSAWFAGIPERGEMARLRRVLAARGHQAITSDTRQGGVA